MTKILKVIVISLAVLLVMGYACAYATDVAVGVTLNGSPFRQMTITNPNLNLQVSKAAGEGLAGLIDIGVTSIELEDNDITPVEDDKILTAQISDATLPAQYGTIYAIGWQGLVWARDLADDDFPEVEEGADNILIAPQAAGERTLLDVGADPSGAVLHGTLTIPYKLLLGNGARLAGATSDTINLKYTFYSF